MQRIFETEIAGRKVTVETGKYAQQANGSCVVRCGDTAVLVCATVSQKPREGIDFFPLAVDYEEKLYSVGKIPGGFIKREGRPTEKAILTSRLIDRPIRPLFPKGFRNDIQIVATVLSMEQDIPAGIYAMIGSSIALSISDVPFDGPTGAVTVGLVDNEIVLNPDSQQREKSRLQLIVSGTRDAVMMVEANAQEVTEEEMISAILSAHQEIKKIVDFIDDIVSGCGKSKIVVELQSVAPELEKEIRKYAAEKVRYALDTFDGDEREARGRQTEEETAAYFTEKYPGDGSVLSSVSSVLFDMAKETVRKRIIKEGTRPDGRKNDEIRPIWCEVGVFRRPHGSAVFTRGQTQVFTAVTLGAMREVQKLDGLEEDEFKRYMHHYNMPPYSTGEARMMRGPGRREIGHGALAERALEYMIPGEEEFPYAIRLVSEVLSSNGSTSQASVCASTLALMDAGVPIKAPVAGIAMGLIKDETTENIAILSDIQGMEDFMGDMDFKVAGTSKGITAIQMDIKIKGVEGSIMKRALEQAYIGRLFILGKMLETLPAPRKELSPFAPKIIMFSIAIDKIREVIGPGGKMINKIIAETGVKIDIEDDGRVFIATPDEEAMMKAKQMIENIAKDVEVGDVYLGKVMRILPFGAFVELAPGKEGMVHISKLANERVEKVEDVVKVGDEILVKVMEIDRQGRINLSRKGLITEDKDKASPPKK
ncbi:MAG: polyribonucleotide nucleotidyltransferase [Bacillota bacterium]|nr:polyribonucleotide nucleotidyltransferase [Bacillota bacterium]